MGNHQTVPLISCQVEKNSGHAGEVVHGLVRLKVNGEQPLEHFEGVSITLAGMEYDLSLTPDGKLHRSNGIRVKLTQQISNFYNGCLPPGVHEFPFELELPDEIEIAPPAPPPPLSGGAVLLRAESSCAGSSGHGDDSDYTTTSAVLTSVSTSSSTSTSSSITDSVRSDMSDISCCEPFREVAYKIRASLKRKPGVPLNSDTHVWCQAVLCPPQPTK